MEPLRNSQETQGTQNLIDFKKLFRPGPNENKISSSSKIFRSLTKAIQKFYDMFDSRILKFGGLFNRYFASNFYLDTHLF